MKQQNTLKLKRMITDKYKNSHDQITIQSGEYTSNALHFKSSDQKALFKFS